MQAERTRFTVAVVSHLETHGPWLSPLSEVFPRYRRIRTKREYGRMLNRGIIFRAGLAAMVVFGTACLSPGDNAGEVEQQLASSALPQPGPGLPPGTVVVPLPEFDRQPLVVRIPNDSGFLNAKVLGHGSEAIVIINGGPGLDSSFVTRLHQGMAKRLPGRRIISYDQRGMGGSSPTTAAQNTIAGAVDDVESIRRFLGVRKIHLVGQSFGGFVAGAYASTHPRNIASIAFVDPLPPLPADSEFTTKAFEAINTYYSELLDAGILEEGSPDDPQEVSWNQIIGVYFTNPLRVPIEITSPAQDRDAAIGDAVDADYQANGAALVANLDRVRIPVLVIGGALSGFGPTFAQGAAEALKSSNPKVVIIQGAGHLPWFEKPAQTLGALEDFFERCTHGH
jgi:proline iminopeptidase